jgi:hypothetical protein
MSNILPGLIERFFTQRLMRQRNASSHTVAAYRDTFRRRRHVNLMGVVRLI